jgi:hypothetical protein
VVARRHDDQPLIEAWSRLPGGGGQSLGQRLQPSQRARWLGEPPLPLAGGGGGGGARQRDPLDRPRDACRGVLVLRPCVVRAQ